MIYYTFITHSWNKMSYPSPIKTNAASWDATPFTNMQTLTVLSDTVMFWVCLWLLRTIYHNNEFIFIYIYVYVCVFNLRKSQICTLLITEWVREIRYVILCPALLLQTLQWRHNRRDGVSNHQPHDCLLNRLFRRRSKKTSQHRVTGLCAGNSPVTGEIPAQRASNGEKASIWWRQYEIVTTRIMKYEPHVYDLRSWMGA